MIKSGLIPSLPFFALLLVLFCNKFPKLKNLDGKISILASILFLIFSFELRKIHNFSSILLKLPGNFDLSFLFDVSQMPFLLLLGCFWSCISLSGNSYFAINKDSKKNQFNILLLLIIGFLSAIILSKNLLTILLFYQFLAFVLYFAANNFSTNRSAKSAKYFGFFILSTSSLLFFAIALTFKISGRIDFAQLGILNGVFANKIDIWQFSLLLFFYVLAICVVAFVPFYLFFSNLYYLNPPAIIIILISFAFSSLLILFKVISYILGTKLLAIFIPQINSYNLLTCAIALNLFVSVFLAITSQNLKQILIWLFFNQMVLVIMEFLVFGLSVKQMTMVIISFVLSWLLIFSAIGNINLYLQSSEDKALNGIFHKLRITVLALISALLNSLGLFLGIGALEKYWLLKTAFFDQSWLSLSVLVCNIVLSVICVLRMIYPMLEISTKNNNPENYEIAKAIELDLNLMLPILILPCALTFILLAIFIYKFF